MALTDNLVSYWKLENTADSHGANTLTNNNSVAFVAGKLNNAAEFVSASSKYLSLASRPVSSGPFSVSFWVYVSESLDYQPIMFQGTDWNFYLANEFDSIICEGPESGWFLSYALAYDTWHHVALTVEDGNQRLYINGTLRSTDTATLAFGSLDFLQLGRDGTTGYSDVLLDELAISDAAWTAAEVSAIYNGGSPLPYEDWATAGAGGAIAAISAAYRRRRS